MRKIIIAIAVLASLSAQAQTGAYNEQALAYISKYKELAMEEQRRSGIPAAITLAQGIHETQAGQSELATEANNHFGIKCKKEWNGETYAHTDDAPNECFRKYAQATDSYRDHSDYLKSSKRYQSCFMLEMTNYAGWASELKKCGYATNPRYAQKLVHIVEDFHLQDYTLAAMDKKKQDEPQLIASTERAINSTDKFAGEVVPDKESTPQPKNVEIIEPAKTPLQEAEPVAVVEPIVEPPLEETTPIYGQQTMRNGLKGFYAHKGDVLLEPAIKYNMRYARMLELNDLPDAPLEADMFIYTEKKRTLAQRSKHSVKDGETMVQIAQIEGIQLKQLRALNQIDIDEEPVSGSTLNLQIMAAGKPPVRKREAIAKAYTTQSYQQNNVVASVPVQQIESPIPERGIVATPTPAPAVPQPIVEEEEEEEVKEQVVAKVETPIEPAVKPTEAVAEPVKEPAPLPEPIKEIVVARPEPVAPTPIKREPAPRPRPAERPKQKTYTIADEPAVGEEEPKVYSPRYKQTEKPAEIKGIDPNLAPKMTAVREAVPQEVFRQPTPQEIQEQQAQQKLIRQQQLQQEQLQQPKQSQAGMVQELVTELPKEAVKEIAKEEPVKEEEPQDEFSRLKRQLDKAVYGTKTTKSSGMTVIEERPAPGREVAAVSPSSIAVSGNNTSTPAVTNANTNAAFHVVKTGETAFGIAKQYGMSMKELMAMNNLNFEAIKVGQKLRVK